MRYPFIVITRAFSSADFISASKGPIMKLAPEYKDSVEIYAHELVHIKQWWAWFVVLAALTGYLYSIDSPAFFATGMASLLAHNLIYTLFPPYRYWSEVQAYRAQAMGNDAVLPVFAECLATIYDLRVTPEAALEKLRGS